MTIKSKPVYEMNIAKTRDKRMKWWRDARFGMFVHYGLYSVLQTHEWAMAVENHDIEEYKKLANELQPKEGICREWAKLAKDAGMKYMVFTTRHHEGFSLWDSKVNSFNSVNYGPKRDIVQEFVDACREFGLGVGFYSSVMDWQHEDSWRCAFDREARIRYTNYVKELNRELMTNYGKIDVLWYDVPTPMDHYEGWNSLEMNQMVRELQPDIIINNRSFLDEDYGTPEEHLTPMDRDWEACMTFNGISWGYIDSDQARAYSYSPQQVLRMLCHVSSTGGNLLLNMGPRPDGTLAEEVAESLLAVGKWLEVNGEAMYGKQDFIGEHTWISGICGVTKKEKAVYVWNWIWPKQDYLVLGGLIGATLKSVTCLNGNIPMNFEQDKHRVIIKNIKKIEKDPHVGITLFKLEFDQEPDVIRASRYPQLHQGRCYEEEIEETGCILK